MLSLYQLSRSQLSAQVAAWGCAELHAQRLWSYLYRDVATNFEAMFELPARLRERLQCEATIVQLQPAEERQSHDRLTRKYLFALADGAVVETALMRMRDRWTVCLSSQAGCALGCVFCATGQAGFTRNLTTAEIVAQAMFVQRQLLDACDATPPVRRPGGDRAKASTLRNIVMMGMGEPLLNYDATIGAIETLSDPSGLAIGAKQITLSTVGVIPGIIRLADEHQPFSLAVSLHAATQEQRSELVPAARTWPLDELLDACRYYAAKLDRRIFFEWTLIEGANDSIEQARLLARLLRDIPSQINLIPLNHTDGYRGAAAATSSLDRFHQTLRDEGMAVSVRQHRGIDIAGGCGQLAGRALHELDTTPNSSSRGKSVAV